MYVQYYKYIDSTLYHSYVYMYNIIHTYIVHSQKQLHHICTQNHNNYNTHSAFIQLHNIYTQKTSQNTVNQRTLVQ